MQALPSIVFIPRGAQVRRFATWRALPRKKSLATAWMAICTGFASAALSTGPNAIGRGLPHNEALA